MKSLALTTLTLTAILLTTPLPSQAQECRTNIGGLYVFVHSGIKPSGNFFSAIAYFEVTQDTTGGGRFDVHATINERSVGRYTLDFLNRPFGWHDGCVVWWDRPEFIGHVADDGATISFLTIDAGEQMAGVATRVRR